VVFDRVAAGVEGGGVEISERLVAFGAGKGVLVAVEVFALQFWDAPGFLLDLNLHNPLKTIW
jgi:hypothetical protein